MSETLKPATREILGLRIRWPDGEGLRRAIWRDMLPVRNAILGASAKPVDETENQVGEIT